MVSRRALGAVGVVVLVVAAGVTWYLVALGAGFQQPRVESVDNSFGRVTDDYAVIDSRVVVDNPNERALPGAARVRYRVAMNDVRVADGTERGVRLGPGRNVVALRARMNNSRIPAWWVTHVNSGERTVVTTGGRVSVAGLPLGAALPERTRRVETDFLGPLANGSEREVRVGDAPVLVVSDRRASWGTATAERTPVDFAVDLRNVHDRPVELAGTAYEIRMNGVVVGEGRTNEGITLDPGESGTFVSGAAIDTPRMQRWWVTHLRRDETTRLEVSVFALVEDDGERVRVPLAVYERRVRFETDLLGSGNTTATPLPDPAGGEAFVRPRVADTDSEWGEVTDGTTEVVTTATVSNPNSGAFGELLELRVGQTTTVNGIEVTDSGTTVDGLGPGNTTHRFVGSMAHDTVPRWWARHLNDGERSVVETTATGTADVGVTVLAVDPPDRSNTVETDLLRNLNDDADRAVERGDRTVLTVTRTRAEWGEATPERAPLTVRMTVRNEQPAAVTIRDVDYLVELNDVTLADRRLDREYTVGPRETRTVELRLVLNNSRMAEWWPTHVRNGERSVLRTSASADLVVNGRSGRVQLDALGGETVVETDLLAA